MTAISRSLASVRSSLAPAGRLRACINLGNPLLARPSLDGLAPVGISVDLAQALAQQLGLALDVHVVEKAAHSVAAVRGGLADIGFFAIDPERGADLAFTPAYVEIEGAFLVRSHSALTCNEQVDQPEHRVVVGQGSAYDLFLTRHLQHAVLIRSPNSQTVVDDCVAQGYEVAAGVRQQLHSDAQRYPHLRLLPGRFMVIAQAIGIAQSRGTEALLYLHQFIEAQKAQGAIRASLARHQITGVTVAAAA